MYTCFIHSLLENNSRILCNIEKKYLGPKSKKKFNLMFENGLVDKLKHGVGVEGEGA